MKLTEDKVPKVLLVGPSLVGGGAQKRFASLCAGLFEGEADVCVMQHEESLGETIDNLKIESLGWRSVRSYPRMVLRLRRKIRRGKYDVVLGLAPYPNLLVWAATRFYAGRPRILLTEISRPWTLLQDCPSWLIRTLLTLLFRRAYSKADLMAANSIDGLDECVKYFGVSSNNIVRLSNLIDTKEIEFKAGMPLTTKWPDNCQVITIAARLERMKRVDLLLEAVSLLPDELNWFVAVVGDGPELTNLRRQAKKLNLSQRVAFLGWAANPFPIVKQSAVCVLCSEFEGFSNWVLEAMFLGVPFVTSFCSSDARAMCEEGAALGFELGDVSSLSKHLAHLLNCSQTRDELTKAAWQYCSNHEVSRGIRTYEQAILRVVAMPEY